MNDINNKYYFYLLIKYHANYYCAELFIDTQNISPAIKYHDDERYTIAVTFQHIESQ
ncbi:hypothetical protein M2387_002819 [Klebsiella sp. BIGb0407]|nr:hypothetical protein [Klebsiella sp. BIGb0407]